MSSRSPNPLFRSSYQQDFQPQTPISQNKYRALERTPRADPQDRFGATTDRRTISRHNSPGRKPQERPLSPINWQPMPYSIEPATKRSVRSPTKYDVYYRDPVSVSPMRDQGGVSNFDSGSTNRGLTQRERPLTPNQKYTETQRSATPTRKQQDTKIIYTPKDNLRKTVGSFNQRYIDYTHSAPYEKGRKNEAFVNPSLVSSDVFYDYNYGYKNDLPNPRLLTPVRNDKFSETIETKRRSRESTIDKPSQEKEEAPPDFYRAHRDFQLRPMKLDMPSPEKEEKVEREAVETQEVKEVKTKTPSQKSQGRYFSDLRPNERELSIVTPRTPTKNGGFNLNLKGINNEQASPRLEEKTAPGPENLKGRSIRAENKQPQVIEGHYQEYEEETHQQRTPTRDGRTPERPQRRSDIHIEENITPRRGDRTPTRQDRTPTRQDRTPTRQDRTPRDDQSDARSVSQRGFVHDHNHNHDRTPRSRGDSTPLSVLSSDYYCANCINCQLAAEKKHRELMDREKAREMEAALAEKNREILEKERDMIEHERLKRMEFAKDIKKKIAEDYERLKELRRSPPREDMSPLKQVFDRQELIQQSQEKQRGRYKDEIIKQIIENEKRKKEEQEKRWEPYNTTIPVGEGYQEGYQNKYITGREELKKALEKQINEKKNRAKEAEEQFKEFAKLQGEKAYQELTKEQVREQMRQLQIKEELKRAYEKSIEEKNRRKLQEKMQREADREMIAQEVENYRRKLLEEEAKKKALQDKFLKTIEIPAHLNYRERYQLKKKLAEATTLKDLGIEKPPKNYPCTGCHKPYPKQALTKMKLK